MTASLRETATLASLKPAALSAEKRSMRVQHVGGLVQVGADDRAAALDDAALAIDFAGGIAARGEAEIGPDALRLGEAAGIVNRCPDRQRDDDTHPRHGHEPGRPGLPDELAVEGRRSGRTASRAARAASGPAGRAPAGARARRRRSRRLASLSPPGALPMRMPKVLSSPRIWLSTSQRWRTSVVRAASRARTR
jgi:hypothetical protein